MAYVQKERETAAGLQQRDFVRLWRCRRPAMTARAELPEQLTVTNGQFIRANGTAVEGALAKGVTISKYQNKAGDIDWNQVKGDGVTFAHDSSGISQRSGSVFCREYEECI